MANEKSTTNSTINTTGPILWRVNYNFVSPKGELRQGAIIVECSTSAEAQKVGAEKVALLGRAHARVVSVKTF